MLNKPKFLSPGMNMQECVVDLKSESIPFSCIVDGNEAITDWRIRIYLLSNNNLVFDTGLQSLDNVFYPIDEKNRNVVFPIDLKKYVDNTKYNFGYVLNDSSVKDSSKKYFHLNEDGTYSDWDEWSAANGNITFASMWKQLYYIKENTFVNSVEGYYWVIQFVGDSGSETESSPEVFYANQSPETAISYTYHFVDEYGNTKIKEEALSDGCVLPENSSIFKATYVQKEGIPLKCYGWRLTDTDSGQVLLDTISKNQIYGTAGNIKCEYSGFLNGCNYIIELYIETQNGQSVLTKKSFSVSYPTSFLTSDFRVDVLRSESGVILDWTKSVVIGGKSSSKPKYHKHYPIVDYSDGATESTSIIIPKNERITFNYGSTSNLDISEDSYIVLSTQMTNSDDVVLFEAEGIDEDEFSVVRKLSFIEGSFVYSVLDNQNVMLTKTYTPKNAPNDYVWYVIYMSPMILNELGEYEISLRVNESKVEGGLYPEAELYPSADLYPTFGNWILKEEGIV